MNDVVQNSPILVHTFNQGGLYDVKLVVTDSRGKVSSNTAHALVEVEQAGSPSAAQLLNISSRLRVQIGDNTLIGGFIITGGPKLVMIRAMGPSLAAVGVSPALANPALTLYTGGTQLASNDDWKTNANVADINASGLAPNDDLEAVLLIRLEPGAYTTVVSGAGGTTGIGLVEVYEVGSD